MFQSTSEVSPMILPPESLPHDLKQAKDFVKHVALFEGQSKPTLSSAVYF